jgi:hypothetical protein
MSFQEPNELKSRLTSYSEVVPGGLAATILQGAEGDRSCLTPKGLPIPCHLAVNVAQPYTWCPPKDKIAWMRSSNRNFIARIL